MYRCGKAVHQYVLGFLRASHYSKRYAVDCVRVLSEYCGRIFMCYLEHFATPFVFLL